MYRVVLCLFLLLLVLVRVWFAGLLYARASCKSGWSISLMCISKDFSSDGFCLIIRIYWFNTDIQLIGTLADLSLGASETGAWRDGRPLSLSRYVNDGRPLLAIHSVHLLTAQVFHCLENSIHMFIMYSCMIILKAKSVFYIWPYSWSTYK